MRPAGRTCQVIPDVSQELSLSFEVAFSGFGSALVLVDKMGKAYVLQSVLLAVLKIN